MPSIYIKSKKHNYSRSYLGKNQAKVRDCKWVKKSAANNTLLIKAQYGLNYGKEQKMTISIVTLVENKVKVS